jgi:8-oxo-dGTP pyrophosphatase MutT (NUDIX family)
MAAFAASVADNVGMDIPPSPDQFVLRFVASHDLTISCGCVPVDLNRRKVAILHDIASGIVQLPKGRKNIGEDLHNAAIRETSEETGITFEPLQLNISTRATPSKDTIKRYPNVSVSMNGLTDGVPNFEASAVCAFRCQNTLTFKLVFWFAAQGDSSQTPDNSKKEPWEQSLTLEWVDFEEAAERMTYIADGQVIEKVLTDIRETGYNI